MIAPGVVVGRSGRSPFASPPIAPSALLPTSGTGGNHDGERLHDLGPVACPDRGPKGSESRSAAPPLSVHAEVRVIGIGHRDDLGTDERLLRVQPRPVLADEDCRGPQRTDRLELRAANQVKPVQPRRELDFSRLLGVDAELVRESAGQDGDALGVATASRILHVNGAGKSQQGIDHAFVRARDDGRS